MDPKRKQQHFGGSGWRAIGAPLRSAAMKVAAQRAWRTGHTALVVAVMLVGVLGASLVSALTGAAETVMPIMMPATMVMVVGLTFGLQYPRNVQVGLEGGDLVVAAGFRSLRLPLAGARLAWARWEPSNPALSGAVAVVETPAGRLRLAGPHLLADHRYDAPAETSHDFFLQADAWNTLTAQLAQALGAPPQPHAGHASYTIPLRRNAARAFDPAIFVWIPGMWAGVGLGAMTPVLWPAPASFATGFGALLVVAALVAFARHRRRESGRLRLVLDAHHLRLLDGRDGRELAGAALGQIAAERGRYVMSTRGGSYTYPVLAIRLPGWSKTISITSGVDASAWAPGARDGPAARHAIGPGEWDALVRALNP